MTKLPVPLEAERMPSEAVAAQMAATASRHDWPSPLYQRLDAVVLAVLVIARLRIDTLAEATVLPLRQNDVARQPWLGHILSPDAMKLLAQQQLVDPIGLLLIVAALGCLILYLITAEWVRRPAAAYRLKLTLVWLIVLLTIFAPSLKLVLLRQGSGPASYSHDGGVIQTEATIDYLFAGRNPYVEDYLQTPMAEWGIDEFRTALYHYPYLPWTFLFSAPFKLLSDRLIGWYDQRLVYLLLFALTLVLLPGLARSWRRTDESAGRQAALLLVMLIGLNPIMGSDLIYGQNDSFVLAWIVLSLWLLSKAVRVQQMGEAGDRSLARSPVAVPAYRKWYLLSSAVFGLACASKPTAWFLAPFYLLLLAGVGSERGAKNGGGWRTWLGRTWRRGWPLIAVVVLVAGPYLAWNPRAMIDDVWGWSSGTSSSAYQIWGWGASNLVLALGWLKTRFAYWPFWIPELLVGGPLMVALLRRQWRENTIGRACWSYALFLFAFFFVSRFLNENYLGYVLAFVILGAFAGPWVTADTAEVAGAAQSGD